MASKVQWSRASTMARNWQSSTYKLLAPPDQSGNPQFLKSWWVDRAALNDILANTPNCTGIRVYPVAQDQDESGGAVTMYHSLVLIGTVAGTEQGVQDNYRPLDDLVYDYTSPCPTMCPKVNEL